MQAVGMQKLRFSTNISLHLEIIQNTTVAIVIVHYAKKKLYATCQMLPFPDTLSALRS